MVCADFLGFSLSSSAEFLLASLSASESRGFLTRLSGGASVSGAEDSYSSKYRKERLRERKGTWLAEGSMLFFQVSIGLQSKYASKSSSETSRTF